MAHPCAGNEPLRRNVALCTLDFRMGARYRYRSATVAEAAASPDASHRARIEAQGTLRIGTTGDFVPFSVEQDGWLSGSDVELAAQLAKRLGVEPVFVRTSFPTLLEDLHANRFDVGFSGISITPKREAVASFSVAYLRVSEAIVTHRRNASQYPNLASLDRPDVRVLVYPGGTGEHFAHDHLRHARIIPFPDKGGAFEEVLSGRVDAMFTDEVDAQVRVKQYPDLAYSLADSAFRDPKGILMPRGSDLVAAVDAWVKESVVTGEPPRLLAQHLRSFLGS
jgi:cyclohexadienyl dehydratase